MTNLSTTFCGIPVKNPLALGAGPYSGTVDSIKRCIDAGFGIVLTKTASMFEYFHRFPCPRYNLVNYEYGEQGKAYLDWVWFHNDHNAPIGPVEFAREVVAQVSDYAKEKNCLLVGTYAASTLESWVECAREYEKAGAGAIELNFCCPGVSALSDIIKEGDTTANYGDRLAENPELTALIVSSVRRAVKIPIICKMPPILRSKIKETAVHLKKSGADAVELYANSHGMRVNIESAEAIGWGCGAVNSSGYLADTLHDVAAVAMEHAGIEVMAGRGVRKWSDAIECLMSGASAVEICTATYVYGPEYVREVLAGMEAFLERKAYGSVDAARGKALATVKKSSELRDTVTPVFARVAAKKCIGCNRCYQVCAYTAVEMFYKDGKGVAKIDRRKCNGCTLCSQVCPARAIELEERTMEEYLRCQYAMHPDSPELEEALKEL